MQNEAQQCKWLSKESLVSSNSHTLERKERGCPGLDQDARELGFLAQALSTKALAPRRAHQEQIRAHSARTQILSPQHFLRHLSLFSFWRRHPLGIKRLDSSGKGLLSTVKIPLFLTKMFTSNLRNKTEQSGLHTTHFCKCSFVVASNLACVKAQKNCLRVFELANSWKMPT